MTGTQKPRETGKSWTVGKDAMDSSSMGLPADFLHHCCLRLYRVFAHALLLPRTLYYPSSPGYLYLSYSSGQLSIGSESHLPLIPRLCLLSFCLHKRKSSFKEAIPLLVLQFLFVVVWNLSH